MNRTTAIQTIRDYYMAEHIDERWDLDASSSAALVDFARDIVETEGRQDPAAMERVDGAAAELASA